MRNKEKKDKQNLIKVKNFCTRKETKQGENTAFRMKENNNKMKQMSEN